MLIMFWNFSSFTVIFCIKFWITDILFVEQGSDIKKSNYYTFMILMIMNWE